MLNQPVCIITLPLTEHVHDALVDGRSDGGAVIAGDSTERGYDCAALMPKSWQAIHSRDNAHVLDAAATLE